MEATSVRPGYEVWRPNREKAESKTTKVVVAFVLLVSAALLVIITIGGWERLQGATVGAVTIAFAALYVLFAFMVIRWSRGILPVASALAVLMLIFAAVSAPAWFARDKEGLDSPALPEELLGLLVVLVIPIQLLLVAVAMFGFNQDWHVEEERPIGGEYEEGEEERYRDEDDGRQYEDRA
jgi:presenilin-like A22 family membrane protease